MIQHPFDDSDSASGEGLHLPPWEERQRYGVLNALYLTTRDVLFSPNRLFHRMPTRLGLVQPLLFGVALTIAASFFEFMWGLMGGSLPRVFDRGDVGDFLRAPVLLGVFWVLSPLIAVVQIVVRAAVFHLGLMLVGGNKLGFEATFRVAAYARAAGIISLLPFCGGLIGLVWELVVTVIGLARIHDVEEWRPFVAVILPVLLFLLSCGALITMIVTAGIFG